MSAQQTRNAVTMRLLREGHSVQVHLSIDDHGMTIQLPSGGQVVSSSNEPAVSDHLQQEDCLPFPQQEEQQGGRANVTAAFQSSSRSYERHETTMQESSNADLCQEWSVFSLGNPRLHRIYFDNWYPSSNGDNLDIRAVIHQFNADAVEMITVVDAVCTHVSLGKEKLEDVVSMLRSAIAMCEDIKHSDAKVLIVRLKRRIACIYFRQGVLVAARQEIDEVEGIIKGHGMIKDCVDVGIIDAYWLLAWIKLFEVWDDEDQLRDAASDILQYAEISHEIAQKLPNEDLRNAYSGRTACMLGFLKLHLASRFEHEREKLLKEARELVNRTSQDMLAKSDRSLWCRLKLRLNLAFGEPSEHFLSQVIAECRNVDRYNNVFTELTAYPS